MSEELPKRLVMYEDEEFTMPLRKFKLGRLDAGESMMTKFYLRNESPGTIEDVKIEVDAPPRRGLSVALLTPDFVERLEVGEVYEGQIQWITQKFLKAGLYEGNVKARGMLTKE